MKKFTYFSFLLSLVFFISLNSCSTGDELEILEKADTESLQIETKRTRTTCDTQIAINYNFAPGLTEQEMNDLKVGYRAHMSQFFTICDVQEFEDCDGSEIWKINGQEYYNHHSYPNFPDYPGTGRGSSNNNDPNDPDLDPELIEEFTQNNSGDNCFKQKEENLNDHLGGL